jgi:glyoxylase-like metal-dependent hydrolase (beta-lactamase superfamily II)/rhodanese-related sulfurtransferase
MSVNPYSPTELFDSISKHEDFLMLDVRNEKDFSRFKVEGPELCHMQNIPYFDFMETEDACVKKVKENKSIRVVCAQEGSAKYVCEILERRGFNVKGYLEGGIKSWGNVLVPKTVFKDSNCEIIQFIRPGKASCSYALIKDKEMMLFDPSRNIQFYLDYAKNRGCKIIRTFETHLQADYIAGSRLISENTGAEFIGNENDFKGAKFTYKAVNDNETFSFSDGAPIVRAIHTPGHTPGSACYVIDEKFVVSGDTIFIRSVGRPDLGGKAEEWAVLLFNTLNNLKKWDKNLQILPGHFMNWEEANKDLVFSKSLDEILQINKGIFDIDNEKDFIKFIKENMRQQPEEYAKIRLVNANLTEVDDEAAETLDLGKNECAATQYAKEKGLKK